MSRDTVDAEDVVAANPEVRERLAKALEAWVEETGAVEAAKLVEEDAAITEELDALGYL